MNLAGSYTAVSRVYSDKFFDELDYKPKDRELLNNFAGLIGKKGVVCDLGCGPGQIAKYLKSKGLNPFGVDISTGMVQQASALNPDIEFQIGNILALPLFDNSIDGAVAFYSHFILVMDRFIWMSGGVIK